ncbi:hypothetical protein PNOK_0871000 [Pyrrhoderma noxium]|uniref:Uncharacterized protein n=1 Tax=Pyrrhoderma noxium TaxID=2282107 RepID=A0A286U8G1_9AGAM|nr:hypothetical protein PNOK_0871000 [Pyrrhoderma noxium]
MGLYSYLLQRLRKILHLHLALYKNGLVGKENVFVSALVLSLFFICLTPFNVLSLNVINISLTSPPIHPNDLGPT